MSDYALFGLVSLCVRVCVCVTFASRGDCCDFFQLDLLGQGGAETGTPK